MLHGASVCVCVFWVEIGACFVLIWRHGGHACSRESILAGSKHQLPYLASSNRVPTATWHAANSADSHNTTAPQRSKHWRCASQIYLFPNRKHPLHIFGSFACVKMCSNQQKVGSRTEEIKTSWGTGVGFKGVLIEVRVDEPLCSKSLFFSYVSVVQD